ncbi:MAG: hypothetical protein WCL19_00125 [Verrucomicrobiota bacterium]
MAQQLVYTSAGKLLDAGRSGFGTVARSKSLSPLLVSAIERVSQFANIRGTERSRVIFVHRRIVAANNRVHLISRIADAGADYTGRTNHIAHHLIVSQEEMNHAAARGITPADILMQFPWLQRWEGAPKFFGPEEDVPLERAIQPSGRISARAAWTQLTGNPSHARLLAWEGAPRNGVLLVPRGADPLALLAEALAEFGPQSWSRTFTTNLETTDEMADFDWVVSSPENFREIEARCGARALLDLSQSHTLPVPPVPVQATPQPKAELQVARQAYAIPISDLSHDAGKRQPPGVQAVKARVSSGSSARHPISKPASSHSWKVRMQMILACAALIVVLGLLGAAVWKEIHKKETIAENQREAEKKAVENILKDAKVSTGVIDIFLQMVEKNPKGWAKFTTSIIEAVRNDESLARIGEINPPNDTYPTPLDWVNSLAEARNSALELSKQPEKQLKPISMISKHIREAAKNLENDDFSKAGVVLVNRLVEEALRNQQTVNISDVVWGDLFADKNDQIIFNRVVERLKNPNSGKTLSDDEIEKIKKAAFIPEAIKESLKTSPATNQTPGIPNTTPKDIQPAPIEPPTGPDLEKVPKIQIIIVTRKQLEEGVEVDLLKACTCMSGDPVDNLKKNLEINGKQIETLQKVAKQDYFSDNWNHSLNDENRKIHKNGMFSWAKSDEKVVSLSTDFGEKSCKAWIVIDEAGGSPIQPLSFDVKEKGDDEVELVGDIKEWMKAATDNQPEIKLSVELSGVSLIKKDEDYILTRKPIAVPLLFEPKDTENVEKDLGLLKQKDDEISGMGSGSKKDEAEAERTPLVSKLKVSLSTAIGGGILRRKLKLTSPDPIKKEKLEPANKVLNEMNVPQSSLSDNEWDKNLADIKKKIGEKKLDDTIKEEIPKDQKFESWDKFAESSNNLSKVVTSLIEKSKKYNPPSALAKDLLSVPEFEVKTSKGRVLFKATRRP